MPTYEYKCRDCGNYTTKTNRIAERKNLTPKCQCGGATDFRISMPMVNASNAGSFQNHKCEHTGEVITSERQFKSHKAKHGLRESREQSAKEYIRDRKAIKAKRDNQLKDLDPMVKVTSRTNQAIGA